MSDDIVERLRQHAGRGVIRGGDIHCLIDKVTIEEAADAIERLRDALEFYARHGAGCRLIHSGGDPSRHALAGDGGKMARDALEGNTND